MDRDYLLKIIEKNFILLTKDEISQKIAYSTYFDEDWKQLIKEQSEKLDDRYCTHHYRKFDVTISKILCEIQNKPDLYQLMHIAEASLLVVSIYYHYSSVCFESSMYEFFRAILKEKILLV